MTGRVTALWRHPIKSHGRETLDHVTLTEGQTMPWDRVWAVAHDQSDADGSKWVPCQHFNRGSQAPRLAAINARVDEATGTIHLTHPDQPDLAVNPDEDPGKLLDWSRALIPDNRAAPAKVLRGAQAGFTDTDYPTISIMNTASHKSVEGRLGRALEPERWRGNIWMDGFAPWEEFDWIGKTLKIGTAQLTVRERVERCLHTAASPVTGTRDTDTLGLLNEGWGHQDFGIYAEVSQTGDVAVGDTIEVL